MISEKKKLTPQYDPWEAYMDVQEYGKLTLTNIEFTTTYLCNLRCEHCAVGYTLQPEGSGWVAFRITFQTIR